MNRAQALREAEHIVDTTKRRAADALKYTARPVGVSKGEVRFRVSFDVTNTLIEIARGKRALDQLRDRLAAPRVVRGDRVGRRRRRA